MFCRRSSPSIEAKVPMSASVAMMPRRVSSVGHRLDELAQRPGRQGVEELRVTGERAHLVARAQRLEDGREDAPGHRRPCAGRSRSTRHTPRRRR